MLKFLTLILVSVGALRAEPQTNVVVAPHASDFVALSGDAVVPFKATELLRARYTVLYFGAGWCPDCRRFSPSLVGAYDHQTSAVPRRFEVLLISQDKSAEGMVSFMKSEKMKWPALAFDKIASALTETRVQTSGTDLTTTANRTAT